MKKKLSVKVMFSLILSAVLFCMPIGAFVANGTVARAFNVATNPVLVCDGTFMENYNGVKLTLLVAVMKTGENHLLPFAVSIVQGESYANWLYFFTGVKRMLQKVGFALMNSESSSSKRSSFENCSNFPSFRVGWAFVF